jgi:hypothetical protein
MPRHDWQGSVTPVRFAPRRVTVSAFSETARPPRVSFFSNLHARLPVGCS